MIQLINIAGFPEDAASGNYTRKLLATKYDISVNRIRNYEVRHDCNLVANVSGPRMSREQQERIIAMAGSHTMAEVATETGVAHNTIRAMIKRHGIKFLPRRLSFNLQFFKTPSVELGYVLGWIASDGCICRHEVTIAPKASDVCILESLCNLTSSTTSIFCADSFNSFDKCTNRTYKKQAWRLTSWELVKILKGYGLGERKSLTLPWPTLPEIMLLAYIRGFFDGDGWIALTKRGQYTMGFCGPRDFLESLRDVIRSRCGVTGGCLHVSPKKKIAWLSFTGTVVTTTILTKIYENSQPDTRLLRKYKKYQEALAVLKPNVRPWVKNTYTESFWRDMDEGVSVSELASKYGYTRGAVRYQMLKRKGGKK